MNREKTIKITNVKQFECLVECMEKNVEVARGYYNFGSSKMEFTNAWNGFAAKLNCLGPPVRDGSGWQKVWTDFKGKIKKKLGHNKKEIAATGGGACQLYTFSPIEESVIKMLSLDRIFPKQNKRSYGLSPVASMSFANSSTLPSGSTFTTDNEVSQNDMLATVPVCDNEDREEENDYTPPTKKKKQNRRNLKRMKDFVFWKSKQNLCKKSKNIRRNQHDMHGKYLNSNKKNWTFGGNIYFIKKNITKKILL